MMQVGIPKGWASAKLRDIAELERDSIQPADISTGTTYVGLEHIVSDGTFTNVASVDEGELASSKFSFSPDHLLYGKLRPYLRKINRPDFHGVCSTDILPIKPSIRINKDYLFHYLRQPSMVELATSRCSGANLPRISPQALLDFPVVFPQLPEQKRIAAILDKAYSIQRKRQEAVRLTEELLSSAFLDMFGDQVANPKGWDVVKLKECCKRITDGTHQPPGFTNSGVPFLFVSNIVFGKLDFVKTKYISRETYEDLNRRCPVEIGDVLYTTVGSYGNAAIVETDRLFSFQRHIAHIKPDNNKVLEKYLVAAMQSPMVKKQADIQARGVAQKTLNLSELKEFEIYLPPRKIQQQFIEQRERILSITTHCQDSAYQADTLFNTLLQRAFKGAV